MRVMSVVRVVRVASAIALAAALALLGGCQTARNLSLLLPAAWTGLDELADDLRIERGADDTQRLQARAARDTARSRVAVVLGEVRTRPVLVFCVSEACYQSFGGGSPRAKSFGDRVLLMGPAGSTAAFVAHEWWHAEFYHRVGWLAARRVPRWFDEGAAVWVSDDPRYGEAMYRRILAEGIEPPPLSRLVTFDDFFAEIARHGDHRWASKPADAVTVVYPTAAHEVRRWMDRVGTDGLRALVERLAAGQAFEPTYRELEEAGPR